MMENELTVSAGHYKCNYALTRVRICYKHDTRNAWWGYPYSIMEWKEHLAEWRLFDAYGCVSQSDEPRHTSMPGLRLLRRLS